MLILFHYVNHEIVFDITEKLMQPTHIVFGLHWHLILCHRIFIVLTQKFGCVPFLVSIPGMFSRMDTEKEILQPELIPWYVIVTWIK